MRHETRPTRRRRTWTSTRTVLCLLTVVMLVPVGATATGTLATGGSPYASPAVVADVSPPAGDLPLAFADPSQVVPEGYEVGGPPLGTPVPGANLSSQTDAADSTDAVTSPTFLDPSPNFQGIQGGTPPDPTGEVGPDHYVEMVNVSFAIYDKQGNLLTGPSNINALFNDGDPGTNTPCEVQNAGDPIVVYDEVVDRWLLSQFKTQAPVGMCVAISTTPDPTGTYYLYDFNTPGTFPDYPKFGVWPDGYYMSSYEGSILGLYAFDRASMLNGNPATFQKFTLDTLGGGRGTRILPADWNGEAAPANGAPNPFLRTVDGEVNGGNDRIEVYDVSINWTFPVLSTCGIGGAGGACGTPTQTLTPAAFDTHFDDECWDGNSARFRFCLPQPGTTQELDALSGRPMMQLYYRIVDGNPRMVVNQVVDVDDTQHAGIRWYELRHDGTSWGIAQQGDYAPDADHRWMGSMALDKAGNIAVGYSVTGTSTFPSVRYAGRLAGDPAGTLPHGEVELVAGTNSQTNSARWGDYTQMSVDPTDDCTFWYVGQFGGNRTTQIGAFRFSSCNPADLEISKVDRPDPVNAGEQLSYDVTVRNAGPDRATGVVVTDTLPSEVDYITDTDTCSESPVGTLTCAVGDLEPGEQETFTILVAVDSDIVADAGQPTTITNTATVTGDQDDPDTTDNSATATTIVDEESDLAIAKECNPAAPTPAGQHVDCTVFVDNHGPSDARDVVMNDKVFSSGAFTITDITPSQGSCGAVTPIVGGSEFTCQLGDLAAASPSTSGRATVSYRITAAEAQDLHNVASVTSDTPDPDEADNQTTVAFSFQAVTDLAVDKTAPSQTVAGESLTFTAAVTNNGPSTAVNVVLEDVTPAGVTIDSISTTGGPASCTAGVPGDPFQPTTCALGTMAPGESRIVTIATTVLPDTTGIVHNDARVTSDTFDHDNSNDLDHTDTQVLEVADLVLTQEDSRDPVVAGTVLDYTVRIRNAGPSRARDVTLVDTLPASVSFASATIANGTGTCVEVSGTPANDVRCELNDLDPDGYVVVHVSTLVGPSATGTLENAASTSTSASDPAPGSNSETEHTTVETVADLAISLTSDADIYKPSSTIQYTITVTNHGPSDAQEVVVAQQLPATKQAIYRFDTGGCTKSGLTLTCPLGTVAAGATRSFHVYVTVKGSKGEVTSSVEVTSPTFDPRASNDSATRTVLIKSV